jgi:flagellin
MTLVASSIANALGSAGTTYAAIKLDSVNNSPIKIDLGQNTNVASHGLLEANVGAADFDVNDPTLSAAGGTSMSGLTITSATSASAALKTLDNAIDSVNAIRGNLGAIQNRLSYTTNNLSSIVTNTEGAKGRIMDADFAVETSKLAKTQILSQAATSMLAQANQSKQGILALLQ